MGRSLYHRQRTAQRKWCSHADKIQPECRLLSADRSLRRRSKQRRQLFRHPVPGGNANHERRIPHLISEPVSGRSSRNLPRHITSPTITATGPVTFSSREHRARNRSNSRAVKPGSQPPRCRSVPTRSRSPIPATRIFQAARPPSRKRCSHKQKQKRICRRGEVPQGSLQCPITGIMSTTGDKTVKQPLVKLSTPECPSWLAT